jgi:hypothetical protein
LQEVLEKFEFFPIKCRILRAAGRYRQYLEEETTPDEEKPRRKLKTKVLLDDSSVPMTPAPLQVKGPLN